MVRAIIKVDALDIDAHATASWLDFARDVAHFCLYHLPSSGSGDLPVHLPLQRLDEPQLASLDHRTTSTSGRRSQWRGHRLGAIGFSAGGVAIALAMLACPIFDAFALIDPIFIPDGLEPWFFPTAPPVGPVLGRRDRSAPPER
jgi:dienelactone hydrolase